MRRAYAAGGRRDERLPPGKWSVYYFVCAVTYTGYNNRMSHRKIYRGYCLLHAALRHTAHLLSGKATHETAKPAPSASRSTSIT